MGVNASRSGPSGRDDLRAEQVYVPTSGGEGPCGSWDKVPHPNPLPEGHGNMSEAASVYASVSILRKMLARLLFWGFIGEVAALQALHGHIGRGQQGAEGFGEHCIGLERI